MSIQQSINQMIGTTSAIGTIAAQPAIQQRQEAKKTEKALEGVLATELLEQGEAFLEQVETYKGGTEVERLEADIKAAQTGYAGSEKIKSTVKEGMMKGVENYGERPLFDLYRNELEQQKQFTQTIEQSQKRLKEIRDVEKEQLKKAEQTRQNRMDAQKARREKEAAYFADLKEAGVSEDYIKANRKELLKQAK